MTVIDGGPAFPSEVDGWSIEGSVERFKFSGMHPGMSLREYLAGKAMQAYISADTDLIWPDAKIAEMSVNAADALLAELAKEKP